MPEQPRGTQHTHPESRFQNSITHPQTGCAQAKMPPYYYPTLKQSIFAEWGLKSRRILVAGCSEWKFDDLSRARAAMRHAWVRAHACIFKTHDRSHLGFA
jgi:hypothetical protein